MSKPELLSGSKDLWPRVAVISPTYNEKGNIGKFVERMRPVFESSGGKLTLLFVDDNSPDGTGAKVREEMGTSPWIRLLEREGKQGLGTAYLAGFRLAVDQLDPQVVVQIDADLQHPPEMIEALVRRALATPVAIGSRRVEGGSFEGMNGWRKFVSWGASRFSRTVLQLPVQDTTTGFKALDRAAVECLLAHPPKSGGFAFQVESLYILKKNGFKMAEVPFTFERRTDGVSKMGRGEVLGFLGVLKIRFRRY